jgi:predicted DNA-binding transcriptional regulator AlpA
MAQRAEITARLPVVFGLGRNEAAAAIGVSTPTFDTLVQKGMMPKPHLIGTRKIWDVDELRAAFKELPREQEDEIDTWADVA